MNNCPHCGMIHQTTCPRIKAIEYNQDGSVKRVEFHAPQPLVTGAMNNFPNLMLPNKPQSEWTQEEIETVVRQQNCQQSIARS